MDKDDRHYMVVGGGTIAAVGALMLLGASRTPEVDVPAGPPAKREEAASYNAMEKRKSAALGWTGGLIVLGAGGTALYGLLAGGSPNRTSTYPNFEPYGGTGESEAERIRRRNREADEAREEQAREKERQDEAAQREKESQEEAARREERREERKLQLAQAEAERAKAEARRAELEAERSIKAAAGLYEDPKVKW